MNYKIACETLGINGDKTISEDVLKKQYRINALRYHPDKSSAPDATLRFQQINAAYQYLLKDLHFMSMDENDTEDDTETEDSEDINVTNSYASILMSFVKNIVKNDVPNNKIYHIILQKISNMCEKKALEMVEKIDKNVLIKVYEIIQNYRETLHFSTDFINKIKEVINKKIEKDECIILNPTLDDLFENNLYKLCVNGFTYIVPLWHDELVYDNSGNDIYVKCFPLLTENITIDNKNNIHVCLTYDIKEILQKEYITFYLGKKEFEIEPRELTVEKTQTVTLKGEGISKINTTDIYDVSKKSNVILHITLE
jgi:DnaJ-class molecular chaperone